MDFSIFMASAFVSTVNDLEIDHKTGHWNVSIQKFFKTRNIV